MKISYLHVLLRMVLGVLHIQNGEWISLLYSNFKTLTTLLFSIWTLIIIQFNCIPMLGGIPINS